MSNHLYGGELEPLLTHCVPPAVFPSPFDTKPHALAIEAAESLKSRLAALCSGAHDFDVQGGGKMFGVLVVRSSENVTGYLSAFSGMLGRKWLGEGFVPPVFDVAQRDEYLTDGEKHLAGIAARIEAISSSDEYINAGATVSALTTEAASALEACREKNKQRRQSREKSRVEAPDNVVLAGELAALSRQDKRLYRELKRHWEDRLAQYQSLLGSLDAKLEVLSVERATLSKTLQTRVFDGYRVSRFSGKPVLLKSLFDNKLPPGGTGDCAAVKLVDFCIRQNYKPLCMAEFWWGAAPASGIRRHGQFYPACRGKCGPVLPFMMEGLCIGKAAHEVVAAFPDSEPVIVFEDEHIVLVNKPAGMLSVPGKVINDSVEVRLRARYPQADNSTLLVHRLDQATSGLLLAAKSTAVHKHLQKQFMSRRVSKRYCAVLDGTLSTDSGTVDLPVRVDINDRPRQLVCFEFGKQAETRYRVLSREATTTRVEFEPVTGRTHQLRVHAAHQSGLNVAIVGDELYGNGSGRLCLHAEHLSFVHPVSRQQVEFKAPAPF